MLEPRSGAAYGGDRRGALGLVVTPDDVWREFDNGPVAALPYAEAEKRYPEPAFRGRFERFTADGGESYADFARRINGALEELVRSFSSKVLIVAHGGSLNAALRDLLHVPVQTSFTFRDTSFAEVTVSRDSDRVRLRSLGRTPHL